MIEMFLAEQDFEIEEMGVLGFHYADKTGLMKETLENGVRGMRQREERADEMLEVWVGDRG